MLPLERSLPLELRCRETVLDLGPKGLEHPPHAVSGLTAAFSSLPAMRRTLMTPRLASFAEARVRDMTRLQVRAEAEAGISPVQRGSLAAALRKVEVLGLGGLACSDGMMRRLGRQSTTNSRRWPPRLVRWSRPFSATARALNLSLDHPLEAAVVAAVPCPRGTPGLVLIPTAPRDR